MEEAIVGMAVFIALLDLTAFIAFFCMIYNIVLLRRIHRDCRKLMKDYKNSNGLLRLILSELRKRNI